MCLLLVLKLFAHFYSIIMCTHTQMCGLWMRLSVSLSYIYVYWSHTHTHTHTHKCGTGDPSLVHSHYISVVLPWQQPIRDLVALGRLGAKVKKNVLLCSVDPQGAIQYFTWHWTGF